MNYLEEIDFTAPSFCELYDELPLWSAPFGLMLLDRVPIKAGLTIVDVGAGTGFLTIELAERCGPSTKVIAVDPWRSAMARLQRKIEQRQLNNIRLLEQDAATLDLPDASVDVIVSNLGINNFDDPPAVLKVCSRVAKAGATLLLTTNLVGHMHEFYQAYHDVLVEQGQRDRLTSSDAHIQHRATVDSVERLLQSAGFELVEATKSSFRMRFADGSALLRHFFIRLGFVGGWMSIPAADSLHATFEALERKLNAIASERGELALTVPMACLVACKRSPR